MPNGNPRKSRQPMDMDIRSVNALRGFVLGLIYCGSLLIFGILQLMQSEGRIWGVVMLVAGIVPAVLFVRWVTRPVDWGPVDLYDEEEMEKGIRMSQRWSPAVFLGIWILGVGIMLVNAEVSLTGQVVLEACLYSLIGGAAFTGLYLSLVWASAAQLNRRRRARGEYAPSRWLKL